MKLFECLETEAFNELITFSLEEVTVIFSPLHQGSICERSHGC